MIHGLMSIIWIGLAIWLYPYHHSLAILLFPGVWYCGREFTQAEYRIIASDYHNKRENMPWYGGLLPRAWTVKGVLDWICPTLVGIIGIVIVYCVFGG